MKYNLDLSKIEIEKYKNFLKNLYLIPSRKILHDNTDANFQEFKKRGYTNLIHLKQALSTPAKMDRLVKETNIPTDYLVILIKEIQT